MDTQNAKSGLSADSTLPRTTQPRRVLVLGAGLSGLVAARELVAAGHHVTVLEGQNRPGGRVLTLRAPFSQGLYMEAGASRISTSHAWTLRYIEELGLSVAPFTPPRGEALIEMRGSVYRAGELPRLFAEQPFSAEERALGPDGLTMKFVVPLLRQVLGEGDPTRRAWPPEALRSLDAATCAGQLASMGASPAAIGFILRGVVPREASMLFILRLLTGTDRDHLVKIAGGNDQLPTRLAAPLAPHIVYGAEVVQLRQSDDAAHVVFRQNGTQTSLQADHIVCTLPLTRLRELKITPALPEERAAMIRSVLYDSVVKVGVQTGSRDTLAAAGLSGFVETDANAEVWHPNWDQPGNAGLMVLYRAGEGAQRLDPMSESERLREAEAEMHRVLPGLRLDHEHSASYSWQADPWAKGAYAMLRPGEVTRWSAMAQRPEGRIHLAGEHTSPTPTYMQGAIESGFRAAHEINELSLRGLPTAEPFWTAP